MNDKDRALFQSLKDEQLLALTILAEAEGEPMRGKMAVGFVAKNRSDLWGQKVKDVCLAHNQFECFNTGNVRLPIMRKLAEHWDETVNQLHNSLAAARGVLSRNILSNVGRATFYKVIGCKSPWFEKEIKAGRLIKVCEVGRHEFFEESRFRA